MTATLSGVNIADASGNRLTDGSAAYIVEQGIQVAVGAGGTLYAANQGTIQDVWDAVRDFLIGDASFASWIENLVSSMVLGTKIDAILANLEKLLYTGSANQVTYQGPEYTYQGYTLAKILADIAAIEAGTGGLTTDEHDQLMALINLDYDQIASTVWGFTLPVDYLDGTEWGPMAQTALRATMEYAQTLIGYEGLPIPGNPFFRWVNRDIETTVGYYTPWSTMTLGTALPVPDLSLVQAGDTVLSFLTREYPAFDWTTTGPVPAALAGTVWIWGENATDGYRCVLTDADMRVQLLPDQITNISVSVESHNAPVWPGLANVTLGTPIALSDGITIDGPMHGLIFTITGHPTGAGRYIFGSVSSWQHVGAVIFVDDAGHYERAESVSLETHILTPRTMEQASSAILRIGAGWTGTVRTWSRNP